VRRLLLLRHGKSDWGSATGGDHERTLAPRGERSARLVGRYLARTGAVPELVISSTAVRARTTAELAIEEGGWVTRLELESGLYAASARAVLEVVRRVPDEVESLLLVGHEPTWSELGGALVGGASVRFPTAGLLCADLAEPSWRDVEPGCGELVWFVVPRMLEGFERGD
jgi:phosphohistidine phosphatase